jgi:DNA-directed RNA polymerase I, II, and III subunit RPABC1
MIIVYKIKKIIKMFYFTFCKIKHSYITMDKARDVCCEMILQRNWTIEKKDEQIIGKTDNLVKYMVFFVSGQKLNIMNVKECIRILTDNDINYSILVFCDSITSSAKNALYDLPNITFELFAQDDLQFNITKHQYAFPHIKLNDQEKEEFIKKVGNDIPILLKTDPMCRFYNFDKGDIIKVIRKNNYVSYRVVK